MATREEEKKIMMSFVTASSLETARGIVRQYPQLKDARALALLDTLVVEAKRMGNTNMSNQLSTARQWLSIIQSGG